MQKACEADYGTPCGSSDARHHERFEGASRKKKPRPLNPPSAFCCSHNSAKCYAATPSTHTNSSGYIVYYETQPRPFPLSASVVRCGRLAPHLHPLLRKAAFKDIRPLPKERQRLEPSVDHPYFRQPRRAPPKSLFFQNLYRLRVFLFGARSR